MRRFPSPPPSPALHCRSGRPHCTFGLCPPACPLKAACAPLVLPPSPARLLRRMGHSAQYDGTDTHRHASLGHLGQVGRGLFCGTIFGSTWWAQIWDHQSDTQLLGITLLGPNSRPDSGLILGTASLTKKRPTVQRRISAFRAIGGSCGRHGFKHGLGWCFRGASRMCAGFLEARGCVGIR